MKELNLLGKRINIEKCPLLLSYKPGSDWKEYWTVMQGEWKEENGWLIGAERGNRGGILFSKERYECDVILSFTAKTVLPATRDVNAVFCANWDYEINNLGNSYVVGLNGWYEGKNGIERCPEDGLRALCGGYKYIPGSEVRIVTGIVDGHSFLYADDEFIAELIDPHYISGGYVGFSPYSTMLAIKDIEIREAVYEPIEQSYEPEF